MKKQNFSQSQPEGQNEEQKNFQSLMDKILSVPKQEIDRREAESRKTRQKGK